MIKFFDIGLPIIPRPIKPIFKVKTPDCWFPAFNLLRVYRGYRTSIKKAAYAAGLHAAGLITISPRNDVLKLKEIILPAYKRGRTETNKEGLGKVATELAFTFAEQNDLLKNAWKTLGICRKDSWSIPNSVAVEQEGGKVTVQELQRNMHFCKKWKDVVNVIEAYHKVGVNEVTNYTGCSKKMIQAFARNVFDVF